MPLDQTHVPGMVVGRVPECDSRAFWGMVRPEARGSHVSELFRAENL